MIKFNTISNNETWKRYLKNPNKFIQNKIHKLNKKFKKYEKNQNLLKMNLFRRFLEF